MIVEMKRAWRRFKLLRASGFDAARIDIATETDIAVLVRVTERTKSAFAGVPVDEMVRIPNDAPLPVMPSE